MARYRTLSNPPIQEAVIELRVRPRKDLSLQDLLAAEEPLRELGFPTRKEQHSVEIEVSGDGQERKSRHAVIGYLFESDDSTQLVHYRLFGFAYSIVGRYESWDAMADEALSLWERYLEHTRPLSIVRIGVRFINRLPQEAGIPFKEILVEPPRMAEIGEHELKGSFQRHLLEFPNGIKSTYVQSINDRDGPYDVLIDTDSFWTYEGEKEIELPTERENLNSRLSPLRDIKNRLFFESLTENALTPYD